MTAREMFTGVTGAVLCAGVLTAAQAPQSRQQPPVFRANTELVEVDVVVVDKAGTPVHGLTRDDFVLRDRRKPQLIETFTEVRRDLERANEPIRTPPGARADVASNSTEQSGRLVVLVLDDLHVWRGRTDTVREIAEKIVADLGPESSMALLQTGQEHSTEVTSDRTRLLDSINRFRGRREFRRPIGACDPSPLPSKDPETVTAWGISSGCNMEDVSANRGLYVTLKDAARILGRGDQRRKAFILVSEHIAKDITGLFDGGTQIPDPPPDSLAYALSGGDPTLLTAPAPVPSHDYALLDMMNAMRRGNVSTYAIDPRGEVSSQDLELECHPSPPGGDSCVDPFVWRSPIRQAQRGLEIVAGETGGFAIVNTDDFTSGIGRILNDLDNYYLLGFYTTDLASKGYRPIEVVVRDRPELTLRYRRGYEIRPDDDEDKNAGRDRKPLATFVDHALPASGVPLRMHAISMPYSGNRSRVAIALELTLPTAAMSGTDSARQLDEIRYGVFAIDLKGAKVREHTGSGARVALRARPDLAALPNQVTYQIALELELPAGRYQLRGAAMSDRLGAGGSVYLSLDVPDFSREELVVTDLLLAYADGPHVPVARDVARPAAGRVPLATRSALPTPVMGRPTPPTVVEAPRTTPFDPTLDRIFVSSDILRLYFKTVTRSRRPVTATISARTAEGIVVVTFDRPVSGDGTVDVRLPLAQLTPGGYRLEVVVKDGERTATKDVGFVVSGR